MHVFIVYAHPSKESFTHTVLETFVAGLKESGNTYEISDLYIMNFKADMDLEEYIRESGKEINRSIPGDVRQEQEKITGADLLVFIYPVWWSDCPAKLKGWFDRVYTLGFAYAHGDRTHTRLKFKEKKALIICTAGHPVEHLESIGIADSMRRVMINDRLLGIGVSEAQIVILGGMAAKNPVVREDNLKTAFRLGKMVRRAVD